jgi:hypothetical protein
LVWKCDKCRKNSRIDIHLSSYITDLKQD